MKEYAIHGGDEGRKRLEILSRTIRPGTEKFLETVALRKGMRCLDLGCGAGAVSLMIAGRVGENGHVSGLDIDERKIQLARESAEFQALKNVDFRISDAYALNEPAAFDLVYSRFLLSHLSKPETVLENIRLALKPGGIVLIEDTDFSGHFSYPPAKHFDQYVDLYQQLLKKRAADANIGQRLPELLKAADFMDITFSISQPAFVEGEGKLMAEITFEGITKALMEEELITTKEAQKIYDGLVKFRMEPDSLISLPRIFQVHGRRK